MAQLVSPQLGTTEIASFLWCFLLAKTGHLLPVNPNKSSPPCTFGLTSLSDSDPVQPFIHRSYLQKAYRVVEVEELVGESKEHIYMDDFLASSSSWLVDVLKIHLLRPVKTNSSCNLRGREAAHPSQPPLRRPAMRSQEAAHLVRGWRPSSSSSAASTHTRSLYFIGVHTSVSFLVSIAGASPKFSESKLSLSSNGIGGLPYEFQSVLPAMKISVDVVAATAGWVGGGAASGADDIPGRRIGHVVHLGGTRGQGSVHIFNSRRVFFVILGCILQGESVYSTLLCSGLVLVFRII